MRPAVLQLDAPVRAALVAVVGHGLPRRDGAAAPAGPLDDRGWRGLLAAVHVERVAGLLDRAVADGALAATAGQSDDAETMAARSLHSVIHLERSLLRVAERMGERSIPFAVLKGPAVARLDETDPALRHFADIDILVKGGDLRSAVDALTDLGYHRDLPERRPGFDRHFAKEVSLADSLGSELDVHRTLALGSFGLCIDLATLWEPTVAFAVGGAQLAALDAEGRFVHACLNAMLGDERPRLVALRDVARISTSHDLRPERLAAIVPPGRGGAVVTMAVRACRSTLGAEVGAGAAAFAARAVLGPWERIALRAYRAHGGSNTLELLSGALGVSGADRLRYLRALVAPDRAYRTARGRVGRPAEWRSGLREIVPHGPHRRRRPGRG